MGGGGTRPAQIAKKMFDRVSPRFGSTSTISRFGEPFRIQFGQFLVCCSSTHGASVRPAICKSAPCPVESAPLNASIRYVFSCHIHPGYVESIVFVMAF